MTRLIPFMSVVIVAIELFAFASRTEQGAMIRADVRKRVGQAIDDAKAMAQNGEDVGIDVATLEVETVSI